MPGPAASSPVSLPIQEEAPQTELTCKEEVALPCNTLDGADSDDGQNRELLFAGVVPVTKVAMDPNLKESELLKVKVLGRQW